MEDGAYVLIGTAIGVLGSWGTTWLNAALSKGRPDPVASARKKLLLQMLEDSRFAWRKFDVLRHVIGADEETTKALLLEVGARASEDGQNLWCLVTKQPFRGPSPQGQANCTAG